jgi:hypothetical protein
MVLSPATTFSFEANRFLTVHHKKKVETPHTHGDESAEKIY